MDYAGVSGASVVELKAELYRAQQDAKLAEDGLGDDRKDRKKAGIDVSGILGRRNAGVEQRSATDDLAYKVNKRLNPCGITTQIGWSVSKVKMGMQLSFRLHDS